MIKRTNTSNLVLYILSMHIVEWVVDINNVGVVQTVTMCSYCIMQLQSRLQLGLTYSVKECTESLDNTSIYCIIIVNCTRFS